MSADNADPVTDDEESLETTLDPETRLNRLEQQLELEQTKREEAETTAAEALDLVRELEDRVAELESRTNLMKRVANASALKPEERAAISIQTLYNKARRNGGQAAIDANGVVDALGGDFDRTQCYGESGVFKKAVRLVDDEDVLWLKKESRASPQNTRLVLDLTEGGLPDEAAGQRLVPPEGGDDG